MLVNVDQGTVTLSADDGTIRTLTYEPLSEREMLLQARYHLFLRSNEYRRELICRRCKQPMESDNQILEGEQAWEILSRCSCRAMYGKIACSVIGSMMTS